MEQEEREMLAFHKAFDEITEECQEKEFRLPNSTDFGFGWRKAREFYTTELARQIAEAVKSIPK